MSLLKKKEVDYRNEVYTVLKSNNLTFVTEKETIPSKILFQESTFVMKSEGPRKRIILDELWNSFIKLMRTIALFESYK